jgi:hypothetical protein
VERSVAPVSLVEAEYEAALNEGTRGFRPVVDAACRQHHRLAIAQSILLVSLTSIQRVLAEGGIPSVG